MANDEKNDPVWKPNEMEIGKEVIVTIEGAKPVATGQSKYGEWNLWIVQVENTLVFDKNTNAKMPGFTGKAVVFPSAKLQEAFIGYTNGTKENTKIGVTKTFKENSQKKPYTVYETRLIGEGVTPASNLNDHHYQFLNAFKDLSGRNIMDADLTNFKNYAMTDTWGITDETIITKLWKVFEETKLAK